LSYYKPSRRSPYNRAGAEDWALTGNQTTLRAQLWLAAGTPGDRRIALTLDLVLAPHLVARHTAMLAFHHDLKAAMRRTLGNHG